MAPRRYFRKSQPTASDVHVNVPLTQISVAYVQEGVFVADQVFPVIPVNNQSDLYYLFSRDDFWRDEARRRAPGTESAGGGFGLSTNSYSAAVEAFHKDIDDQTRANADTQLSLDASVTRFVTQKLMIRREVRWMGTFFTTGVWGTDMTGVGSSPSSSQFIYWDTTSGSDPKQDVIAGKTAILQSVGFVANTLLLGYPVYLSLTNHPAIRDQFKYTSADSIDVNMLARYFDVERVLVTQAVYNTAAEGDATQTTAFIGGKNALLCYTPSAPSILQPAAGYTFAWTGFLGATNGLRMKRIRMEWLESDRIEGEIAYDFQKVASGAGYFFSGAVQ